MRALLLFAAALLLAPGFASADWLKSCRSGQTTTSLSAGEFACHNPASADDDPSLLNMQGCENWDAQWYDDLNGDGSADADGTASLYTCPVVAADTFNTEAKKLAGCQPLSGGTVLSGTNSEAMGVGSVIMWADIELASTDNQLVVRCSGPSGR